MRRKAEDRPIVHEVPVFDDAGERVGTRWFRTMTEAKDFAKDQCKRLDHKGYTILSHPFESVAEMLARATGAET